tara:strand:- start:153 stop:614 length:462 start_codon:yes stop_codon:yes gene_type:complete
MNKDFREIMGNLIHHTLMKMPVGYYSPEAEDMVYRTGMAETRYKTIKQYSGGPAIGFFQIEPDTLNDTMKNYVKYRPPLLDCLKKLGLNEDDMEYSVLTNIALQIAFCRIHYRRNPYKIPGTLEEQGKYWKEHYNTKLGKGTVRHFIESNTNE